MLKKGFTLAEILISMGVIGVVSAMVIPKVTTNVEKNETGLKVAKTVEQVEVACRNYLMIDPNHQYFLLSEKLPSTATKSSTRAQALSRYIGIGSNTKTTSIDADDGIELSGTGEDKYVIAYVIDTNGTDIKPNKQGRDKFIFYLNNSCRMIPYGVDDMKYRTDCNPSATGGITDYKTCAARLVKDGYKIKY